MRPTLLDIPAVEVVPDTNSSTLADTVDSLEVWYNNSFLIGLRQAAGISEHRTRHCFNCQKEGHCWCDCPEVLSPELQEISNQQDREREERKKKALNRRGGLGRKGGHAPIPLVGISPVPAPVLNAPTQ